MRSLRCLLTKTLVSFALTAPLYAGMQETIDKASYEVASIKRNTSSDTSRGTKREPNRLTITNTPVLDVIEDCYDIRGYEIASTMPSWVRSEPYDIILVTKEATPWVTMQDMLKSLLAERFRLRFHWDNRDVSGFALRVGANGPKFYQHQAQSADEQRKVGEVIGVGKFSSKRANLTRFAGYLSIVLQVPVIDETELQGDYEISLEFTRDVTADLPSDLAPPSLASALGDQLGLKLSKRKVLTKMFVLDYIDRPSEN